jgi:hypothetical protein
VFIDPAPRPSIEQLRHSRSKYQDIYLKGYADGREAKAGIADWLAFTIIGVRTRRRRTGRRWRCGATAPTACSAHSLAI